jgi:aspartyl-tRNA(Asn)/glutamyl-tRNA(Gln) amidotransferase subunit A
MASALSAKGMARLKVGVVRDYPVTPVTPPVASAFAHSLRIVEAAGAAMVDVGIPALRYANEALWIIMVAEAAAVHEDRLRTRRSAYTPSTLRLLTIGEHCSAADYLYALRYRARLVEEFASAFDSVDVILWPTKAETAGPRRPPGDQFGVKLNLELRAPYNLTGMPAITVPVALDPDGLPIGMQFAGPLYQDLQVLQAAKAFAAISDWKPQIPLGLVNPPGSRDN